MCVAYKTADGETRELPTQDLDRAMPIYRDFEGWKENIGAARAMADLPHAAQKYVSLIEDAAECEAMIVSVGPARDQTILRSKVFD